MGPFRELFEEANPGQTFQPQNRSICWMFDNVIRLAPTALHSKAIEAIRRIQTRLSSNEFLKQYQQVQSRIIGGGRESPTANNYCAENKNHDRDIRCRIAGIGTLLVLRKFLREDIPDEDHESFVYGMLVTPPSYFGGPGATLKHVIHPNEFDINAQMKEILKYGILKPRNGAEKTVTIESCGQLRAYESFLDELGRS